MAADQLNFIKRETDQLIDLQIKTFRKKRALTSAQLFEFHMRAKRLETLFGTLDEISRSKTKRSLANAS
jgi:hypothetical protein